MTTIFEISRHVTFLANPALKGRVPLSAGSEAARNYIINEYRKHGLKPLFDDGTNYTQQINIHGTIHGTNVGGIFKGNKPGYVLLGAHYDHVVYSPGADDNAAAVAQVLSIAEHFSQHIPVERRSILFLAFDCEEPPYFHQENMGSIFFTEHCPVPLAEIQVAIILDLTGHRVPKAGLEDCLFTTGTEYATTAHEAVTEASTGAQGIRVFSTSNDRVGDMSDHHAFRINHRPFIFLSCGRGNHYHQPSDTIENLDLPKTAAIAAFLARLVTTCADGREFTIDMCKNTFQEREAAGLSRLLGKHVDIADVQSIMQSLRGGL